MEENLNSVLIFPLTDTWEPEQQSLSQNLLQKTEAMSFPVFSFSFSNLHHEFSVWEGRKGESASRLMHSSAQNI